MGFWGLFGPLKNIESLCCGVRSKSDHSVLNNGTTCDASFRQNSLITIKYLARELNIVDAMTPLFQFQTAERELTDHAVGLERVREVKGRWREGRMEGPDMISVQVLGRTRPNLKTTTAQKPLAWLSDWPWRLDSRKFVIKSNTNLYGRQVLKCNVYCVYSATSFYPENYVDLFRVHVHHTGLVRWWIGGVMETSCHLDGTLFPFDSQSCSVVVQSWAYSEAFVDLRNASNYVHLDGFNDDGKLHQDYILFCIRHPTKALRICQICHQVWRATARLWWQIVH